MPKEMQLLALNLSVVGLARSSTPKKSPTCLALGLIRSIDLENRLYFVLSPISLESLRESQVNTFIVGKLQIPNTILSQPENANGPYLEYSGFMPNIGASTRKVRANIARKWNGA